MADDAQMAQLAQCLSASLSPDQAQRAHAEQFLTQGATSPGFSILLLKLLAAPEQQPGGPLDARVRQAAAVAFKNLVKAHWVQKEPDVVGAPAPYAVPEPEKAQVRALLVGLMLSAPRLVRAQLSEALAIVSAADFPARWPQLLPELVQRLQAGQGGQGGAARDFDQIAGVLTTANAIFKRFRDAYKTEDLYRELKYVLDEFVAPSVALFLEVVEQIKTAAAASNPGALASDPNALARFGALLSCARLSCRVFFSLNSQELPEVFEDAMDAWFGGFRELLVLDPDPALVAALDAKTGDDSAPNALDEVKAAVCDNINLYVEKNEEEFQRFLQTFVGDAWRLLTRTSLDPRRDRVVASASKFLTAVANSVHHGLFGDEDTLKQICESIVIPNVQFREEERELFEMNWVEYARRDVEGSDAETRRKAACELAKALTNKFPDAMLRSVGAYATALLQQHANDPMGGSWKAKDAAMSLVIAVAAKSRTNARGATETRAIPALGDVARFFDAHVATELQKADAGFQTQHGGDDVGAAVCFADALKFLTVFRAHVPKASVARVLPSVVRLLAHPANVAHSYAAICLERLMTTRGGASGVPDAGLNADDLAPHLQPLLVNLFGVFALPDSRENEYAMRCAQRTIAKLGANIAPAAETCADRLAAMLVETCANPRNPAFSHYLFESVAALVAVGASDANALAVFERAFFPPFQHVLQNDVVEFAPYVFQILAQMLEARGTQQRTTTPGSTPVPGAYMAVFPALLVPLLWDRQANVTPLVRLLEAYLRAAPREIAPTLGGVLGVFQKLVSSRAQDHQGFFILNALVECLPLEAYEGHLPAIWGILFQRLQSAKTQKFVKCLVVFTSLLVAKRGVDAARRSMAEVQPGIFEMILCGVYADAVATISGAVEVKVVAVASATIMRDATASLDPAKDAGAAFGKLLTNVVLALERESAAAAGGAEGGAAAAAAAARGGVGAADDNLDEEAEALERDAGYSASYSQLRNAARKESDPCADVADARTFLAAALAAAANAAPGTVAPIVAQKCPPEVQQALGGYCQAAGVAVN
jgi:exportin-2 (importin alpha re-exporter)